MRSPIIAWKVILTAVIVLAASSGLSAADADSIVYQNDSTFTIEGIQNELKQDGDWIKVTKAEIDPEGVTDGGGFDDEINTEYIWRPRNMGAGWSPYTNGYWSYTNCGWMWTSYYSWGWRPYHYGRWWWSDYYGWVWSPGFVWAPAWVVWMYNDRYCGWYPISPRVRWQNNYGYGCRSMRYRVRNWTFTEKPKFHDPLNPPVVIVDPSGNTGIINTSTYNGNITIEGSTVINKGPEKTEIESATGRKIEKVDVVKYNNVTQVTGVTGSERNNSGKNTDAYKDNRKIYGKQDPNTNKENEKTGESEKKTYEKTGDKSSDRSTEKKKDDTYKNNDGYKNNDTYKNNDGYKRNEKKSNDTYKEKQKETYKDSNRSNEKRSNEKRSNDNKQESKPPKNNNDNGSKNNNGKK